MNRERIGNAVIIGLNMIMPAKGLPKGITEAVHAGIISSGICLKKRLGALIKRREEELSC